MQNIAKYFTSYDLLNVKKLIKAGKHKGELSKEIDYKRIKALLTQNKPFDEIKLDDTVAEGDEKVKIEVVVGNPPYQDERKGNSKTTLPIYHKFMDIAYLISEKSILITPARFLFNVGRTPKKWNVKMLSDPHFEVQKYEPNGSLVFDSAEIKGGIAITNYDHIVTHEPINVYTPYETIKAILEKIKVSQSSSMQKIIFVASKFNMDNLVKDYPEYRGHERRLSSNVFSFKCFHETKQKDDYCVFGLYNNKRCYRFINKKYIDFSDASIHMYKIVLPKADGVGEFGDTLTNPVILSPKTGFTHSFLGIGGFNTQEEANNALKYIKTKFVRALLSVLKVTQDNTEDKWKYVPIQDFSSASIIDWSKSVTTIDEEAKEKYGFDIN